MVKGSKTWPLKKWSLHSKKVVICARMPSIYSLAAIDHLLGLLKVTAWNVRGILMVV